VEREQSARRCSRCFRSMYIYFFGILNNIQLTPQKLSAGRKNRTGAKGRQRVARKSEKASREKKLAYAGIERFCISLSLYMYIVRWMDGWIDRYIVIQIYEPIEI